MSFFLYLFDWNHHSIKTKTNNRNCRICNLFNVHNRDLEMVCYLTINLYAFWNNFKIIFKQHRLWVKLNFFSTLSSNACSFSWHKRDYTEAFCLPKIRFFCVVDVVCSTNGAEYLKFDNETEVDLLYYLINEKMSSRGMFFFVYSIITYAMKLFGSRWLMNLHWL